MLRFTKKITSVEGFPVSINDVRWMSQTEHPAIKTAKEAFLEIQKMGIPRKWGKPNIRL